MAQYDLVFVQNNASSGVAFSEIKLGKPPDVGFALTQHPNTGLLSWVQSMNLIAVYGQNDTVNFDSITKTGVYHIHPNASFVNGPPKCDGGILFVSNSPNGIYQLMQGFEMSSPKTALLFARFFDSSNTETWTPWKEFGSGATEGQWGDDPAFSKAVQTEIENTNIEIFPVSQNSFDLHGNLKNRLILLYPVGDEPQVIIHTQGDMEYLQLPQFEVGSVYTIYSMSSKPILLEFLAPLYNMGDSMIVHTEGYYHPGKFKSIQLILIGQNEWLVEGAVNDPPGFEEDEVPGPIKN